MQSTKFISVKNKLLILSWFLLFGSLSVSKGLQTITEVAIIVLSLDKILNANLIDLVKKNKFLFIFSLFYLVLIFGLFYTENLSAGIKIVKHHHRWVVIPLLIIANADLIKKWFNYLALTFVLTASLASAITILFHYMPEDIVISISKTVPLIQEYPLNANKSSFGIYSPFVDRLQFSNLIGIAFIFTLFIQIKRWFSPMVLLCLLPLGYCSIILGGRGGQLALAVAFIVYLGIIFNHYFFDIIKQKIGKKLTISVFVMLLLVLLSTPYIIYKTNSEINSRYGQMKWELTTFANGTYEQFDYVHFTSVRRIISWVHLIDIVKENPFFGVGTGDVEDELKKKYAQDEYHFPVNIHSQYLYFASAVGIVGLLVFLLCCGYWLHHLSDKEAYFFGIVFLTFYGITMLTDASLIKQVDLMSFSVFTSFLAFGFKSTID